MGKIPSREEAWTILTTYNATDYLQKHALAVEGVMRYFAKLMNEPDVDFWGVAGLLHDLDYEQFPDAHCIKSQEIMRELGLDERLIRATASHGYGLVVDIKPEHPMEKVLFAVDELTGLIHACALMRPSKSVLDMEAKSVKKKYKTQSFAAGVSRDVIEQGAAMMAWSLDDLIYHTLEGMKTVANEIGLGLAAEKSPS
jgi:putative nucleotidyltransferase with HDIG domain